MWIYYIEVWRRLSSIVVLHKKRSTSYNSSWRTKCFLYDYAWLSEDEDRIFSIKINDEETIFLKHSISKFASSAPQCRQLICDHRLSLWSLLSLHLVLKDSRASQNQHFRLVLVQTRLMKFNLLILIILLGCKNYGSFQRLFFTSYLSMLEWADPVFQGSCSIWTAKLSYATICSHNEAVS